MTARTFVALMLVFLLFTVGLLAFSADNRQPAGNADCPAGASCAPDDSKVQSADGMIWETLSRHLLSSAAQYSK